MEEPKQEKPLIKKYEVLASHCGRRTFTTLWLRKGMSPEDIRAVTKHTTAGMTMKARGER